MKTKLVVLGALVPLVLTAIPSFAQTSDPSRESPKPRILDESEIPNAVPLPSTDGATPGTAPPTAVEVSNSGNWKIWSVVLAGRLLRARTSRKTMASENASSPVEQPGIQARSAPPPALSMIPGRMSRARCCSTMARGSGVRGH
jgi:hypothetical protein